MITALFKKLNYKDQKAILIHNAPESFNPEINAISKLASVSRTVDAKQDFLLLFVVTMKEMQAAAKIIDKNKSEAVIWIAYPKQSSKKYTCEFNRDTGWEAIGAIGFEPVRQIAIDEDWSALRLKKPETIKKMIRRASMAITKAGKEKTLNKTATAIKT